MKTFFATVILLILFLIIVYLAHKSKETFEQSNDKSPFKIEMKPIVNYIFSII